MLAVTSILTLFALSARCAPVADDPAGRVNAYFDRLDSAKGVGSLWYSLDISRVSRGTSTPSNKPTRAFAENLLSTIHGKVDTNIRSKLPRLPPLFDQAFPDVDIQPVVQRSHGFSDFAQQLPNSPTTLFRAASITKTFTATMIFQLIDEGKLRLDQYLADFFPNVPNAETITIEQLLAHESGIGIIERVPEFKAGEFEEISRADMLDFIYKLEPSSTPGEVWAYNNANFILLAFIIEDVDGGSYDHSLQRRIARPLRMRGTYDDLGRAGEAKAFVRFKDEMRLQKKIARTRVGGSGAIVSTVEDLRTFIIALMEGELVSKESLDKMKTQRALSVPIGSGPFVPFCLGLMTITIGGRQGWGHFGNLDAFNNAMFYFPPTSQSEAGVTYVIMTNYYDIFALFNFAAVQTYFVPMNLYFGEKEPEVPGLPEVVLTTPDEEVEAGLVPKGEEGSAL